MSSFVQAAQERKAADQAAQKMIRNTFNELVRDLRAIGFKTNTGLFTVRREYVMDVNKEAEAPWLKLLGKTERFNESRRFNGRMLSVAFFEANDVYTEPHARFCDSKGHLDLDPGFLLGPIPGEIKIDGAVETSRVVKLSDKEGIQAQINDWVEKYAPKIHKGPR